MSDDDWTEEDYDSEEQEEEDMTEEEVIECCACPLCDRLVPCWVLDCNGGLCINCAVAEYARSNYLFT